MGGCVGGEIGGEQVERHAAHLGPQHLHRHPFASHVDVHRNVGHPCESGGVGIDVVVECVLDAGGVDVLGEVAVGVEQPDTGQGEAST